MTAARFPTTFLQLPDFIPEGVRPPCRDVDPELFFPLPTQSDGEAKAVCRRCPVEADCATWATDTFQQYGIFGGLDPTERNKLRGKRARAVAR